MIRWVNSSCRSRVRRSCLAALNVSRWPIAKPWPFPSCRSARHCFVEQAGDCALYDHEDALAFAGSKWAKQLGELGTSCPDHFLRTRICPMYVDWKPGQESVDVLKKKIADEAVVYRGEYAKYYQANALPDSPKLRDSNPSVVIIPGLGLFGFGKNKKEAKITTEFFINAIHVMSGANTLAAGDVAHPFPQAKIAEKSKEFETFQNYVALPRSEAFRIEYWALEEAKFQRMPPEAEFSRKIVMVVGGGSGIGREVALLLARKGAHVVVADMNEQAIKDVAAEVAKISSADAVSGTTVDISSAESVAKAAKAAVLEFGGIDAIINTAAIFPVPGADGQLTEAQWSKTFLVNVTGNFLLARECGWVLKDQKLPASIVLTSSANAVVSKFGSEAYDVARRR